MIQSCSSVHVLSPAQPVLAGDFDILPNLVTTLVLSKLHNPLEVSPVCRKFNLLARAARDEQLHEKGVFIDALAKACGLSSIHPLCIEILLQYAVNLSSIGARETDDEIREEFEILLDHQLQLLQHPKDLDDFLRTRLSESSWAIARYCFRVYRPSQSRYTTVRRVIKRVVEFFQRKPVSSVRAKAMREVLESISGQELAIPGCYIPGYRTFTGIPLSFLALFPFELWGARGETKWKVWLDKGSFVPSGIGSIPTLFNFALQDSSCRSLPEPIPDLRRLTIWNCPNLQHFPKSLRENSTLQYFSFFSANYPNPLLEEISQWPLIHVHLGSKEGIDHLPKTLQEIHTLSALCTISRSWQLLKEICQLPLQWVRLMNLDPNPDNLPSCLTSMGTLKGLKLCGNVTHLENDPIVQTLRERKVIVDLQSIILTDLINQLPDNFESRGNCIVDIIPKDQQIP